MGISALAVVDDGARVSDSASVWHWVHVREHAIVNAGVTIGAWAYIDHHVQVGVNCKIGNGAQLFYPAMVEDGVFIGPRAMLLNDRHPRAVGDDGHKLQADEWTAQGVYVESRASIGAGAILMPGVRIGLGARIGAGAVVLEDVPAGALVVGVPGRTLG